ncbi:hypothetical protein NQ317_004499 [Molorchus minor]|uniref:Lipase n=1 Tax=Molorchus minor TaxID=1323400 RepID=A0ABQ9J7R2_9CUCU|nr:hypothetical protein NQ317_004499 [Molorchus minor]
MSACLLYFTLQTTFVSSYGYPIEAHQDIQTEDGYLLDIFRIPYGRTKTGSRKKRRPVVFLMHGLLSNAENWIIGGPQKGLAFLLADRGYDVWMGNSRGSVRKHVSLSPRHNDFWEFSWHEIGIYDLPASINYILGYTKKTKLFYIGHSQGTTAYFVMVTEKPHFNANITLMAALAPVAYMKHVPHPVLRSLAHVMTVTRDLDAEYLVQSFINLLGHRELIPNREVLSLAGQALCKRRSVIQEMCINIIFLISGYDSDQFDKSLLPLIVQTLPAGSSIKQFFHYTQEVFSGYFRQFNYGSHENVIKYGSVVPPAYNLSLATAPIALFHSKNDWLVSILLDRGRTRAAAAAARTREDFALVQGLTVALVMGLTALAAGKLWLRH